MCIFGGGGLLVSKVVCNMKMITAEQNLTDIEDSGTLLHLMGNFDHTVISMVLESCMCFEIGVMTLKCPRSLRGHSIYYRNFRSFLPSRIIIIMCHIGHKANKGTLH